MGRGLYFKWKFLTGHPSAGAVANVDFKLYRGRKDGNRVRRKIESSSSEEESFGIGAERRKILLSRPENGTNVLYFFALEGKIEQQIRISAR